MMIHGQPALPAELQVLSRWRRRGVTQAERQKSESVLADFAFSAIYTYIHKYIHMDYCDDGGGGYNRKQLVLVPVVVVVVVVVVIVVVVVAVVVVVVVMVVVLVVVVVVVVVVLVVVVIIAVVSTYNGAGRTI